MFTLCAAMVIFSASGCDNNNTRNNNGAKWYSDFSYHWQYNENNQYENYAKHSFGTNHLCTTCGQSDPAFTSFVELSSEVKQYYAELENNNHTGQEFLADLRAFNNKKRTKYQTYDGMRYEYKYTDIDPLAGPGSPIISFYSNTKITVDWDGGATWNREHVWPNSRGGGKGSKLKPSGSRYVDADFHMPRPAVATENGSRNNKMYAKNAFDPGYKYPAYRGIAARIIFYCAMSDADLKIERVSNKTNTEPGYNCTMGNLTDLLQWNKDYLPSNSNNATLELRVEQNRNNVIQKKYQGNRNPFIDHPEYAFRVWGY